MSASFRGLLSDESTKAERCSGRLVGLEHEYTVRDGGRVLDFRSVIHGLRLGDPHLDPGDPNAYRLPSGAAVTADEAEAEIALPPFATEPGFSIGLAATANSEREALAARLTVGTELIGYSTHVSVSVPSAKADRVARLYAATFAPALMLLMDLPTSPGLLVRPRPGRLELGGEFVDGADLSAVALFAVGSVRACLASLAGAEAAPLPAALDVAVQPDDRRFGWFVSRVAFGGDLYRRGRTTALRTRAGQMVTAQSQLEAAWTAARAALGDDATPAELALVDGIVRSVDSLPRTRPTRVLRATAKDKLENVYGAALMPRRRPGYELAPVMLTWDTVVFVVANGDRSRLAFAHIPGRSLPVFEARLDAGDCDEVVREYLFTRPGRRMLTRREGAAAGGLFDRLGPRANLLTRERAAQSPGAAHALRTWSAARFAAAARGHRRQRLALTRADDGRA